MLATIFRKQFLKVSLIIPMLGFLGCNGILDCPIDPPSCCYNIFFGCDIFEIPEGCTCSQYGLGLSSSSLQTKVLSVRPNSQTKKSPGFIGNWSGKLKRVSTNCTNTLRTVDGEVRIRKDKQGFRIDIPGYGKLFAEDNHRRIRAKGVYNVASCQAEILASLQSIRAGVAKTDVSFRYLCRKDFQCSAKYNGVINKK